MKIWFFNEYGSLPSQSTINRHYFFAKQLQQLGHEPMVFVGSHPHNTKLQMISGNEIFRRDEDVSVPWIYVRTPNYEGSTRKRVFSMFQYYRNAKKAAQALAQKYGKPDVIIGSSAHPLAAVLAIRLGKKYHCKAIAEVRDLWPESIVAYGIAGPRNPLVVILRHLEKWIYQKADALIFVMAGAYDYITEQGWEKEIPRSKVYYINNGVDLEAFQYNREHFQIDDPDLQNPELFKIVYTGSIRLVNNLGLLLDVAKQVTNPRVRFLIWGDGEDRAKLEQRVRNENITNIVFKGRVDKKYIPFITSQADANLMHGEGHFNALYRFGISPNKLFDYFAACRPILMDFKSTYNPVEQYQAGLCVDGATYLPQAIEQLLSMQQDELSEIMANAAKAAQRFDFRMLTQELIGILEKGQA